MDQNSDISSGPEVLGILLTSKCNVECRHCCNDSHPRQLGAASFEDIARLITMAREQPSIKEIGISGGEPFIFFQLLRRVISFASSLGFTTSVTTNGRWARSSTRARTLLEDLRSSGLTSLHISTSVFHQEFIDLNTLKTATDIGLSIGLRVGINLVSTTTLSPETLRSILGELAQKVDIVVMPCLPAGRGATRVRSEEFIEGRVAPQGNCRSHFKKLAVDLAGDLYPCCSPGGFTPPLMMGNVRTSSLRDVVDANADNKLLAILETVGPQFFLPFLRAANVHPPLPERFVDQCHLCNTILASGNYAHIVKAASEQLFSELEVIARTTTMTGGNRVETLLQRALNRGDIHGTNSSREE